MERGRKGGSECESEFVFADVFPKQAYWPFRCIGISNDLPGLFIDNASCGYILKPTCLLEPPFWTPDSGSLGSIKKLTLRVFSGRQFQSHGLVSNVGNLLKIGSVFLAFRLCGIPQENSMKFVTKQSSDLVNPEWKEEFVWDDIRASQLAVLSVKACRNFGGSGMQPLTIATSLIPLRTIRPGLFNINFRTSTGAPLLGMDVIVEVLIEEHKSYFS